MITTKNPSMSLDIEITLTHFTPLSPTGGTTLKVEKVGAAEKCVNTDYKVSVPHLSIHSAFHCPSIHWNISLGDTEGMT